MLLYQILNQIWILLTSASAIAGVMIGAVILIQITEGDEIAKFKKAIAYAFFGVTFEIISRYIALITTTVKVPLIELIICSLGRFVECVGLWGLVFYILHIWPFRKD